MKISRNQISLKGKDIANIKLIFKIIIVRRKCKMRFISGILFGIFSVILILIQGCFITWNIYYPEMLFYIITIISIICTAIIFITIHKNIK